MLERGGSGSHQSTVSTETETETETASTLFDKSTNKTNKRSHFPPHAHMRASRPAILPHGNAPLRESGSNNGNGNGNDSDDGDDDDADADSDTVVNRMTAPNNKVISSPNKRGPQRKAKAE